MDKLVLLGRAFKAHGIKGEFKLILENSEDSVLKPKTMITLKSDKEPAEKTFTLKKIRFGNQIICQLEGIDSRNAIEEMLPFELYLKRSQFPTLAEGEFYLFDLIGFKAIDEDYKLQGTIEAFSSNGAQTLIVVRWENGDREDIPWVDAWVGEVSLEDKTIAVRSLERASEDSGV